MSSTMGKKKNTVNTTPSLFDIEQALPADTSVEFAIPTDLDPSWLKALEPETHKPYWNELQNFVAAERAAHTVYPPEADVFNAFRFCPLDETKVFLLGQD